MGENLQKNGKEVYDGNEEIGLGYDPEGDYLSGFGNSWGSRNERDESIKN